MEAQVVGDRYFSEDGTPEPEPCDGCELGLVYMFSHDFRRLCRNCVYRWAEAMGWNTLPEVPEVPVVEEVVAEPDNTGDNGRSEETAQTPDPEPTVGPRQEGLF